MIAYVLIIYGAVLTCIGVQLLGKVEPNSVWPINLIGGTLGLIVALQIGFTASMGDLSPLVAALLSIFAVTFVMFAAMLAAGLDGKALGYYCVFAGAFSLVCAYAFFTKMGSLTFGVATLIWAGEFALFAAVLAFGRPWAKFTGIYTLLMVVVVTLFIPGSLMLLGVALP